MFHWMVMLHDVWFEASLGAPDLSFVVLGRADSTPGGLQTCGQSVSPAGRQAGYRESTSLKPPRDAKGRLVARDFV